MIPLVIPWWIKRKGGEIELSFGWDSRWNAHEKGSAPLVINWTWIWINSNAGYLDDTILSAVEFRGELRDWHGLDILN